MSKLTIVKTLPHLIPWHTSKGSVSVYATSYNLQIERYLTNLEKLVLSKTNFGTLQKIISDTLKRESSLEPGNYIIRGDTISVWPIGYEFPLRLTFFDQEFEKAIFVDPGTGKRISEVDHIYLSSSKLQDHGDISSIRIIPENENFPYIFLSHIPEESETSVEEISHDFTYPQLFWSRLDLFDQEIDRYLSLGYEIKIVSRHKERMSEKLQEFVVHSYDGLDFAAGFISASEKLAVFTDREIFGTLFLKNRKSASGASSRLLRQFEGEITPGDFIVHQDHGVGIYSGITQELVGAEMLEYLQINYAGEDKLLVPVSQIEKLTKYIGLESKPPKITSLSSGSWDNSTKKVKQAVVILAKELVEHYARREMTKAVTVESEESPQYQKFVRSFPFKETKDQITSINEVLTDLESSRPMNRLLIGDVGFGKTEVIMRAAFKIVEAGYQVAVLTPTTILAAQHLAVFKERFEPFKIKVGGLSRFNTAKQNLKSIEEINTGDVDIVIGTHRLLSGDVKFSRLGLLAIDEEQRFGVKQKEKIKQINYGVHFLSASATPIPRTLSMALSNIQDISVMTTPPVDRLPVTTELVKDDWNEIVTGIHREVSRGGQVYFVHNRVQSIQSIMAKLKELIPGVTITIAHGQMSSSELNKTMSEFYQKKFQVLLTTTIIENGLDLPNVNTIIINQAHKFGLSQLYQLRGRVGRSKIQAYCYLFYQGRDLSRDYGEESGGTEKVMQKYLVRLQSLVEATELGAGFRIASRDLEIRGAGSLLGEKQSGHISHVGYALYMRLLAQEIDRLKEVSDRFKPEYLTL